MTKNRWMEPLPLSDGRALPTRVLPGPMDGITENSFVSLYSRLGYVDSWFTPFIRISNGIPRLSRLARATRVFREETGGLPWIGQIMGTIPAYLAGAAQQLHQLGALCVDLNCGCPSPTVLSSHSGGYHLKNPDWIHRTLCTMREKCGNRPISAKIRIGFDSTDEMKEIAQALRGTGLSLLFCHYRTVREQYAPVPKEERRRRLLAIRQLLPDIPLCASGDIASPEDAEELRQWGMDGLLVARGLVKDPLLIRKIVHPDEPYLHQSNQDRLKILQEMGELSGKPDREQGFLLRMARMMFGEESDEFQQLLSKIKERSNP